MVYSAHLTGKGIMQTSMPFKLQNAEQTGREEICVFTHEIAWED
jgi:hypothetical protein